MRRRSVVSVVVLGVIALGAAALEVRLLRAGFEMGHWLWTLDLYHTRAARPRVPTSSESGCSHLGGDSVNPTRLPLGTKCASLGEGIAPVTVLRCEECRQLTACLGVQDVRVVPSTGGGPKLYDICAGSPLARLGLENGDTLLALEGRSLATPDQWLTAYNRLQEEAPEVVHVDVARGGARHHLVVVYPRAERQRCAAMPARASGPSPHGRGTKRQQGAGAQPTLRLP